MTTNSPLVRRRSGARPSRPGADATQAAAEPAGPAAGTDPDGAAATRGPDRIGSVVVVVDGSVATIGAARWASAVARHTGQGLVAIVLHQAGPDGSGQVVLGRTEPTLRSSGTPLTVLSCRVPAATSPRRQARLLITSVRRCLASVDVALLVLPGDRRLADPRWRRHSLVAHLAAQGDHDLLIVPGLGDTPARRTAAVGG